MTFSNFVLPYNLKNTVDVVFVTNRSFTNFLIEEYGATPPFGGGKGKATLVENVEGSITTCINSFRDRVLDG